LGIALGAALANGLANIPAKALGGADGGAKGLGGAENDARPASVAARVAAASQSCHQRIGSIGFMLVHLPCRVLGADARIPHYRRYATLFAPYAVAPAITP
jgi:hypothetical protein